MAGRFNFLLSFVPSLPPSPFFCPASPPSSHVEESFEMENESGRVDTDMIYPMLYIPKTCTTLETNCDMSENVYIDVNITSPDTEGNETCIYNGFCNIKLVEPYENVQREQSPENSSSTDRDIEQMPIILSEANQLTFPSYNQSRVWIDPSRSPYVNNYDSTQEQYSICESRSCITVEQHNTYITQNVYNYKESNVYNVKEQYPAAVDFEHKKFRKVPETTSDPNLNYYEEDEFQCGVFLSQLPEEIMNEKKAKGALKQLMSSDFQSGSKQRKTIMYLGQDSNAGQTLQNISYSDPNIQCALLENEDPQSEATRDPMKKQYQCDKCKQIFRCISDFRQHMVGKQLNLPTSKTLTYKCTDCGRHIKNLRKFEMHCLGHGDPELECDKCHKVYASKFTLRTHRKIHNRNHPCDQCSKAFDSEAELKSHLKKSHMIYICEREDCPFVSKDLTEIQEHETLHKACSLIDNFGDTMDSVNSEADFRNTEAGFKNTEAGFRNTEAGFRNTEAGFGNTEAGFRNTEAGFRSAEAGFRSTEAGFRNTEEGLKGTEASFRNNEADFRNNYAGFRNTEENLKSEDDDEEIEEVYFEERDDVESETESMNDNEVERIKNAETVLAKVMSNKIFLLNSKKAKQQKFNKICEVCFKNFDRISDLKRHLIEHIIRSTLAKTPVSKSGTLTIVCEVCNVETFNRVDKYKAHLREHAKLTIYQCTFCDKSFSDSSNFSKHKKTHGIAYLQCDLCQRKFNSKKMIAQHMEYHIRNSPVKCRFCDKVFHFESMLNKHVKSTHSKETVSKFRCRFCEGTFKCLKDKWDHEWEVHSVRKVIVDCTVCGSKFRKYSVLKRHCIDIHQMNVPPARRYFRRKKHTVDFC